MPLDRSGRARSVRGCVDVAIIGIKNDPIRSLAASGCSEPSCVLRTGPFPDHVTSNGRPDHEFSPSGLVLRQVDPAGQEEKGGRARGQMGSDPAAAPVLLERGS